MDEGRHLETSAPLLPDEKLSGRIPAPPPLRHRLELRGLVQGVGFRPYVYRLAQCCRLVGWVCNTTDGVTIEIEGQASAVSDFERRVASELPPAAQITQQHVFALPAQGGTEFVIAKSRAALSCSFGFPPDLATCPACRAELFDSGNRRHAYAFTNCTHCGPRYTIIRDIPYDRAATTMRDFALCPECAAEYSCPNDRRFHAQPDACARCGPHLAYWEAGRWHAREEDLLARVVARLQGGGVLAVKGLGGYFLVCDAQAETAVQRLRRIKRRDDKPFAVMVPSLEAARALCRLSAREERLLASPAAPILLARRRATARLAKAIAPNLAVLGLLLPYTPLHHLLLHAFAGPLVMTSANQGGSPILYEDDELVSTLGPQVDGVLAHNRPIHVPIDDSVVMFAAGAELRLRVGRGYVPRPIRVRRAVGAGEDAVLALGGMLKASFTLLRGEQALMSQYFGDISESRAFEYYTRTLAHWLRLLRVEPRALACDLHPGYPSRDLAETLSAKWGVPVIRVQHHRAHMASVLAEARVQGPVLGVAFDGTGYGEDGTLWGGEFFLGPLHDLRRIGHLAAFPLPSGERAIREPWRIAFGLMHAMRGEKAFDHPLFAKQERATLETLAAAQRANINCPLTTSAGRLFDALSALLGVRTHIDYEGQAAIELEACCDRRVRDAYPWAINGHAADFVLSPLELFECAMNDTEKNVSKAIVAARIHNTFVAALCAVAERTRVAYGVSRVALCGGVFQNRVLLESCCAALKRAGFTVLRNREAPPNDQGLSLGQALLAAAAISANEEGSPCVWPHR